MSKKELRKLAQSWREYADGHYCQTYNKGMGDGLRKAANELESALKKSAQHRVQPTPLSLSSAETLGDSSRRG
jgi:hypothetical protein